MATIALPGSPQIFDLTGRTSHSCDALFASQNGYRFGGVPSPTGLTANLTTPPPTPRRKSAIKARPIKPQKTVNHPTATAKKTVRFDEPCENVRFFLTADAPVASVSEPYSTTWGADATETVYNFPFQLGQEKTFCRSSHALGAPSPLQPIRLQSLELSPSGHEVRGTVAVLNLAFEKDVSARFSLDKWKTVSDVGAEHVQSHYVEHSIVSDVFSFMIDKKNIPLSAENDLRVCVWYKVLDHMFWDNNGGINYQVVWRV